MNLVQVLAVGNRTDQVASKQAGAASGTSKVSKADAGYVYRQNTDYRCTDCWQFISGTNRCLAHGRGEVIKEGDYCTYWLFGTPMQSGTPKGSVNRIESGWGNKANGTKCKRCVNFDPAGYCKRVDEKSPGDTPGKIHPDACCSLQSPSDGRTAVGASVQGRRE